MAMFWNRKKKSNNTNIAPEQTVVVPSLPTETAKQTRKKLSLSFLKRLIPIGDMPDDDLQQLTVTLSQHKPGEIIFNQNDASTSLPYIIKGQIFLETNNRSGYEIDATALKAHYPLSNATHYQCTAIARSDVSIIHFPTNVLQNSNTKIRNPLLNANDIPEHLQDNLFFKRFYEYFKKGNLIIPSLPDVSIKLRAAVQKEIGIKEAVKIVNLDPVISSKLIQVVNSPLYRTLNPISSCHDAVNRLGLTTTRNLVTSISMQNLFKSKNKALNAKIHMIWKQSIQVSSISQTLASLTKKVNPDEALLAGLVHNIGALPIVIFAESLESNDYTDADLNLSIHALQGILGNIILEKWEFPFTLRQIPRQAESWYHDNSDNLDLSDIVLLAKFHSYLGTKHMQNLPPIHTLPAFQKLGDNTLTPDMSLQTLHNAKQQISDAMGLFGN